MGQLENKRLSWELSMSIFPSSISSFNCSFYNTSRIKFVTNGKGPGQKVRIFNTFFAPLCWSNTSWGETQFAVILSVKACVTKTVWAFGIEKKNRLEEFTSRMQACCIFDCVVYRCYRKAFIACKQPRRWRRGRVPLLRMRYMHFADSAQPAPHTYEAIWKCKISSEIWMNPDIIFCPDSLTLEVPWFFHQLLDNAISIFAILIRSASSGQ